MPQQQYKKIIAENGILFVDSNGIPKYGFRLKESRDIIFKGFTEKDKQNRNPDFFELANKQYNG